MKRKDVVFGKELIDLGKRAKEQALGLTSFMYEEPREEDPIKKKNYSGLTLVLWGISAVVLIIVVIMGYMLTPPLHFPTGVVVRVEEGWSLTKTANHLKSLGVIRSRNAFIATLRYKYSEKDTVIAGDYFFAHKDSVFEIARKMSEGDFGMVPFAVTIPEGVTVAEMALIFDEKLSRFDTDEFTRLAAPLEGYLFPDTYYFLPTAKPRDIVREMHENFQAKIALLEESITASGKTLEDIIIMASIVEEESEDDDTARRTIAGVLWKRLEINMPLQVDAAFRYIIGKGTFDLTMEDLAIDSPYNTYKYEGLPPGPISNPGLDAIKATINPIETKYLFFLADMKGKTHFARTFAEHEWNIRRYHD